MHESNPLRRNVSWAFAGNGIYLAFQWGVLVILTKNFPAEQVGLFALAVAVTGPVFTLSNLRLRNLLATERGTYDFSTFFLARVLTTITGAAISMLIAAQLSLQGAAIFGFFLVVLSKGLDAISDICHGLFQRLEELRLSAIGLMINGAMSLALVLLSQMWEASLNVSLGAYALGSGAALLLWDLPRAAERNGPRHGSRSILTRVTNGVRLLRAVAPLGVSSAVGSLQVNAPKYAVASVMGPEPLAIFAALSYLPVSGALVTNAVGQAALPALAADLEQSPVAHVRRLRQLVVFGMSLGVIGIVVAALFGDELLSWLYTEAYAQHTTVLMWLVVSSAVSYGFIFMATAATARRRFNTQLKISCASLFIVSMTAFPLVKWHGLVGAAWSMLLAASVEALCYVAVSSRDAAAMRLQRPSSLDKALTQSQVTI